MNQHLLKIFSLCITILTISFFMASFTIARQVEGTEIGNTGSKTVTDNYESNYNSSDYGKKLTEITNDIRKYALSFIAFAAVATAIIFMTAAVNPEAKTMGKIALTGIVIGTMFLLFSDGIGKIMFSLTDTSPSKLQVDPGNKKKAKAGKIVGNVVVTPEAKAAMNSMGISEQSSGIVVKTDDKGEYLTTKKPSGKLYKSTGELYGDDGKLIVTAEYKKVKTGGRDVDFFERWTAKIDGEEMFLDPDSSGGSNYGIPKMHSGTWRKVYK